MDRPWWGVDLDGTWAEDGDWRGPTYIGRPIPRMTERIKSHLAAGDEVRIFTARVCPRPDGSHELARLAIAHYCMEHLGRVLESTCEKDYNLRGFYDDRAIQIIPNTGLRADGKN